jgi:hypothetical protein
MDLRAQAVADAGGPAASLRDRLFSVGGIVAKVLLCPTLPFGFFHRGFFGEVLFFTGVWLLISSANTIVAYVSFWLRNLLGRKMTWTEVPPLRYRIYAVAGAVLVALSQFHLGIGAAGHIRVHPWAVVSSLFFVAFWAAMIGIPVICYLRARGGGTLGIQHHAAQVADRKRVTAYDAFFATQWSLGVGVSTGVFTRRDPSNSFVAGLHVRMSLADASRCVLATGSMGSGKSQYLFSCAHDAARQIGTGLLTLSAKPSDATTVAAIAQQYRPAAQVHVIGPDTESLDLIAGMTPARVGAAFRALSHDSKNPFWSNYAGMLCTAAAQLAWGLSTTTVQVLDKDGAVEFECDFTYDLKTIHRVIWGSSKLRTAALESANAAIPELRMRGDLERIDALAAAINYFTMSFLTLQESKSTFAGILSGIEPFLIPLISGTTSRTWCDSENGINLTDTLDRGECVILAADKAANPQLFALVANFCVSGHLGDLALRRTGRSDNDEHPIVCLLDEFGSYASESIFSLVETARQARIALVISVISITNLAARLGRDGAASIPSAFGNWICFGTTDELTRKMVTDRVGKVRMSEISSGSSTSTGSGTKGSSSSNVSTSHRITEINVVDDEIWHNIGVTPGAYATAIAIVSEGLTGHTLHDVVRVPPASVTA